MRRIAAIPSLLGGALSTRWQGSSYPTEGAMHDPDLPKGADEGEGVGGKETWSQYATRMRHNRRRIRTVDVAGRVSYEYRMLRILCRRRPTLRQWAIRDDFCVMNPGVVVMSPSMQAAFMRVFRMKSKGEVRRAMRDIVPVIMFRNSLSHTPERYFKPEELIPKGEAESLNQKKRELFERQESIDKYNKVTLKDDKAQAKLRARIRQKLIKFQRKMTISNAIASRAVLYGEDDAIGYLLFRGPPMYAAMHRVFFELSKLLPHFVPKTMLDFGSGTGTAILAAKEVFDPGSLSYPLYRNFRQAMQYNASSQQHLLEELQYDLRRLQRNNDEKKRARFMAVSALLENGEIDPEDLPKDLLKEIVAVSKSASHAADQRKVQASQNERFENLTQEGSWDEAPEDVEDTSDVRPGEEASPYGFTDDGAAADEAPRTWWQKYIDDETSTASAKATARLRPLQSITAVEPAPGMVEVAMVVLAEEAANVQWKRYLLPEDVVEQRDLVVAAYALSELATPEARMKAVQDLWKMTRGVLVLIEHANLHNFDMLMKARDAILEEKDVGMWDWQPTIVGPCPHEKRCPIRHAAGGLTNKKARICSVDVDYRATFVDAWVREAKFRIGYESFSYLIIARNELVPSRAEARQAAVEREARKQKHERDQRQRDMTDAAAAVKDLAFERLSDEALHRPGTSEVASVVTAEASLAAEQEGRSLANPIVEPPMSPEASQQSAAGQRYPMVPKYVSIGQRVDKLVYPYSMPPATHRYNRGFVDNAFQATRPLTPGEMITVRHEAAAIRAHYQKQFPQYYRIVRYPLTKRKLIGTFCTPDGDLITGKVRRFLHDQSSVRYRSSRWATIGGYKLLRRARPGDMFPHNVPVFGINRLRSVDRPNTLYSVKEDPLTLAAIKEGDLDHVDPDTLTHAERRIYDRHQDDKVTLSHVNEMLESLTGQVRSEAPTELPAEADMAAVDWAEVVEGARKNAQRRMTQVREPAAPLSKKKRQALRDRSLRRSK